MAISLFKPADAPSDRATREHLKWWTWSDSVRGTLDKVSGALPQIPSPELVHLLRGKSYDYTYTLSSSNHLPPNLTREIRAIALAYIAFDPGENRLMFRDLLRKGQPKKLLHIFFALIRQSVVEQTRDPMSAMYAPLGTTGIAAGEFRLHADLYIPEMLFNVFDDVPEDGTGASTFLSTRSFKQVLRGCAEIPRRTRLDIERLFRSELKTDGYERFIRLVHDESNAWHERLWCVMEQLQETIALQRGEGYLLNDRMWLHGRTEPSNKVSRFRVHRLIFGRR